MDAEDLRSVLGATDDSPRCVKLLGDLGVKKKPKIASDRDEVLIELNEKGLVLVFERVNDPKTSKIQLAGVQMYSDAEKGYALFAGKLPSGLAFTDSRAGVLKKLGKPAVSRPALKLDVWKYKDHRLAVRFVKDQDRIKVIHLMTLEEDD